MNAIVRQNLSQASELWKSGKSITEIANMYGVSRQSIAGFMNRNRALFPKRKGGGINSQSYGKGPTRQTSRRVNIQRVRRAKKEAVDGMSMGDEQIHIDPSAYDAERLTKAKILTELCHNECRWPIGNDHPVMFCAEVTGATYCDHHAGRAYRPWRE